MREIKFCGKRVDNGEWAAGYYWANELDNHFIRVTIDEETGMFVLEDYKVIPETVGQFTGLLDKNGKEIYEGNIVDHYATFGYVLFEDGMFTLSTSAKVNFGHRQPLCYIDSLQCEIIGNIHENPELLKEGDGE